VSSAYRLTDPLFLHSAPASPTEPGVLAFSGFSTGSCSPNVARAVQTSSPVELASVQTYLIAVCPCNVLYVGVRVPWSFCGNAACVSAGVLEVGACMI
jgi:hypothetical protein